jgi:Glycosyl transferase family 2
MRDERPALQLPDLRLSDRLPMVTAMVATYNYERYLGRALDSVLAQDYPADRLEIVVIDDGSTDGTPELLERYRTAFPDRVRVIRQLNAGNKAAANAAVAAARGDVLAMLDADDTWPQGKTRLQVQRLLDDPTLGLVYCDQEIIDSEDRVLRPSRFEWLELSVQRGHDAFAQMMGPTGNIAVNSTIMFRRELADHLFPIPLRMRFQDWWIVSWASTLAGIDCVEDVKIGYRLHNDNGTLGGTGSRRVWATCKAAESRRQMLVHGGGDLLAEQELLAAHRAWEDEANRAAEFAGSTYVPLIGPDEEERAAAIAHAARAADALAAADRLGALRAQIRAVACDPQDADLREGLVDLTWATDSIGRRGSAPVGNVRRLVTAASLAELLTDPALLAGYASAVTEIDDATLVVVSRGLPTQLLLPYFGEAVARAGLTLEQLPDVVVADREDPAGESMLHTTACALTERWWDWEPLPVFRPGGFRALRALGLLAPRPATAEPAALAAAGG